MIPCDILLIIQILPAGVFFHGGSEHSFCFYSARNWSVLVANQLQDMIWSIRSVDIPWTYDQVNSYVDSRSGSVFMYIWGWWQCLRDGHPVVWWMFTNVPRFFLFLAMSTKSTIGTTAQNQFFCPEERFDLTFQIIISLSNLLFA